MNDVIQTLLVFCLVTLAGIFVVEALKLIHVYRLRVNRDAIAEANERCAKYREENDNLRSQVSCAASREYVNTITIGRLTRENEALLIENTELKAGTPVKEPIRVKRFKH